jgi:hypothetical protein
MVPQAEVRFAKSGKEHEAIAGTMVLSKTKISYKTFLIFWFVLHQGKMNIN